MGGRRCSVAGPMDKGYVQQGKLKRHLKMGRETEVEEDVLVEVAVMAGSVWRMRAWTVTDDV